MTRIFQNFKFRRDSTAVHNILQHSYGFPAVQLVPDLVYILLSKPGTIEVCDLERQGRYASSGDLIPGTQNYRVLIDTERPTGIPESLKGDVVRHVIIDPTGDGYHGAMVYGSPGWRSGWMSGENGVFFHEHGFKPLINLALRGHLIDHGDEEESLRQLQALRAMQHGGFNAYAESWRQSFAQ